MSLSPATNQAATNLLDLFHLSSQVTTQFFRGPRQFDVRASLVTWLQQVSDRLGHPPTIRLNILGQQVLLVRDRALSDHILAAPPSQQTYVAGALKKQAMETLAPAALVTSQDTRWQQLRPYNERVLAADAAHPYQAAFLSQVISAFEAGITDLASIRQRMGQAMVGIVFGEGQGGPTAEAIVRDVQHLANLVENPLKRITLGRFSRRRRDRLYQALKQVWQASQDSEEPSLLAMAQAAHLPQISQDVLLQQIPHWMFPFTGSGSTLLGRTLTLILSQPAVLARVQQELGAQGIPVAGGLGSEAASMALTPEVINQLPYLDACLLETGRLYPPVLFTLHRAPQGDVVGEQEIPANIDILQVFPLMQHPVGRPLRGSDFQPDRWLTAGAEEPPYSNLFLSGSRTCPGKDLILFVCKAAIADLLTRRSLQTTCRDFTQAPWPAAFPDANIRFQ